MSNFRSLEIFIGFMYSFNNTNSNKYPENQEKKIVSFRVLKADPIHDYLSLYYFNNER